MVELSGELNFGVDNDLMWMYMSRDNQPGTHTVPGGRVLVTDGLILSNPTAILLKFMINAHKFDLSGYVGRISGRFLRGKTTEAEFTAEMDQIGGNLQVRRPNDD